MSSTNDIQNRSAHEEKPVVPRLAVDLRFSDIETWAKAIDWDLGFRQLSAGRLNGRVRVITGAACTAMKVELDQTFHQIGNTLPGQVTLGLPDPQCGEFNWCGSTSKGGELLNFSPRGGFDGTSGRSFSGCALSFRRETLEDMAETLDLSFEFDRIQHGGGIILESSNEIDCLRRQIDSAFQSVSQVEGTDAPWAKVLFDTGAAESILRLLDRSSDQRLDAARPARQKALREALEIIEDPDNLPISVADLCKLVGISAPSLYRAFKETFGVGTKEYIRARLLAAVRSELIAATSGTRVNDVANKWGVWHMGRLAAEYRRQFGELPSETLQMAPHS